MLDQCPCFESGETEWTEAGTNRHKLFSDLIRTKAYPVKERTEEYNKFLAAFSQEDIEACEWAADYFLLHAPLADHPWFSERKMSFLLPDFSTMEGTPDAACGNHLFDLKSRERDYAAQMAAYALMIFEAHPEFETVHVHLLFSIPKRAKDYTITREESMDVLVRVLNKVSGREYIQNENGFTVDYFEGNAKPKANDYCGWCKKNLTCPAVVKPVKQVATGYSDKFPAIDIANWHPSQVVSGEEFAVGLEICAIVEKWAESWRYHALEFVRKGGAIPGYSLGETKGRISCSDVASAFTLAGLPQDQFLKCCDLRLNTSKTYADKLGAIDVYAQVNGIKKSAAKKELTEKLSAVLRRGNPSPKLIADKGGDESTEE